MSKLEQRIREAIDDLRSELLPGVDCNKVVESTAAEYDLKDALLRRLFKLATSKTPEEYSQIPPELRRYPIKPAGPPPNKTPGPSQLDLFEIQTIAEKMGVEPQDVADFLERPKRWL